MNKIEVAVLRESSCNPAGIMMFLAKLTQRGHCIKNMDDLMQLYRNTLGNYRSETVKSIAALPHGTIKRFTPITVAIVGASRRFLAQARTHQVGFNYVSASLQYSNYSGEADFVVPYALLEAEAAGKKFGPYCDMGDPEHKLSVYLSPVEKYLEGCKLAMNNYEDIASMTDNDTAGYAAPQGLRNILIMQANHEAWMNFIRLRACNRNTTETQYVTLRIWEALLNTYDGEEMFYYAGPDCMYGVCREGKGCCKKPMKNLAERAHSMGISVPSLIIKEKWPLLEANK